MADHPQTRTTVKAHKDLLGRMLGRLNQGDVEGFVEGLAPNYVRHCQAMPPDLREIRGRKTMKAWLHANLETFPDYREKIEWLVGEGDHVAWRSRARGTMKGAMGDFPATGEAMDVVILGMHRFEEGRIAETWTAWDNVAVLSQLGLMPRD
jgi:predicted ester cyclase